MSSCLIRLAHRIYLPKVTEYATGRVIADFAVEYRRMVEAGVEFVTAPRTEPYGRVAVFLDIAGNRWDLLGPAGE
ncbi:VOC family protein [Nocardia terrae]|uniref:VOC family protein n=1 Tax=Nocardia terrae TaxID=2675851 RepID=UPI0018DF3DAD|nr:VOC family protein [Nocardia terrae]